MGSGTTSIESPNLQMLSSIISLLVILLSIFLPMFPSPCQGFFFRRPALPLRESRDDRESECAEFVRTGAELIPSYCNIALLNPAEESSTVRARQMRGWGWAEWTEWGGCGACPREKCPSSCRMRCRYCNGVCQGQASELDNCPQLASNETTAG